jgi:hypothetical protein
MPAPELDRPAVPAEPVAGLELEADHADEAHADQPVLDYDQGQQNKGQEEPAAPPARAHTPAPTPRPTAARTSVRPTAPVSPRTRAAPRQVAEVEVLGYWRDALSVVHRISRPDSDREVGTVRLAVEDGCLKLFGRDHSRAHWSVVPARTEGAAVCAMDRADIAMKAFGQAGRLSIFEAWLLLEPASGGAYWVPSVPVVMPAIPNAPGVAGVVLHRDDLAAAIREAVGGCHYAAALPAAVRLVRDTGDRLVVEAEGRGTVTLPLTYANGNLDVRLRPRMLLDAIGCCPSDEVVLESLGRWQPLRLESGWFTAIMATRTEDPLL